MNFQISKGRRYLIIGAVLIMLSMCVTAFTFGTHGNDSFTGYQVWIISIRLITDKDLFFKGMFLCAAGNIFQLIYPIINSRKAGTSTFSKFWVVTITFIILPLLA